MYQYIYSTLFLKNFCRVDDYGIKSKLAFKVAHAGYRSQQQSLRFVHLPVMQEQTEIDEVVEVVEASTPPPKTMQKSKKRKIKNADIVAEKNLLKKKKREGKKAKLLSELETNDLHMKRINSNINKNK